MVRDVGLWEILNPARFAEADIDDAAADPGDESRSIGWVYEPDEDDGATVRALQLCEGRE
jgi:hypothetical protein